MTEALLNVMRREAGRAMNRASLPRMGVVTSYDPAHYAVKVRLQPTDQETGWLPVASIWTGNGWGLFCPPSPGDVVDVHFQEGGKEAGYVSQRFFSSVTKPLPVPSGECWQVHKSGSYFKMLNDGSIEMVAVGGLRTTAETWHHTGNLIVSGDITDRDNGLGSLHALRTAYDTHRHYDTQPGSGTTGLTDHPV